MSFRDGYLFLYNTVQFIGWSLIFWKIVIGLLTGITLNHVYSVVGYQVEFFQTLALLEIVHSYTGLVRSPTVTTAIQVLSRLFILWPITHCVVEAQSSLGTFLYITAWSISEIVRYSFYALNILAVTPKFLIWLRYTLFIGLYPLGVAGELLAIFAAMAPIGRRKLFTLEMPNIFNMSFNFYYSLFFIIPLYIPLFPKLYIYMLKQRKKVLYPAEKKFA
ncbi:Very-long-chain (3R)-3-hydroxyacyl-CoA dehydratase hpo-8 [Trichinella pseudospiralis]